MNVFRTGLHLTTIPIVLLLLNTNFGFAQKASGTGAGASSSGNIGSSNRGTVSPNNPSNPNFGNSTDRTGVQQSNPIFLSGQVLFSDGTPPNMNIRIERVCASGGTHFLAHTDSKGFFYFQLGQNEGIDADASDQNSGLRSFGSNTSSSGNRVSALASCDIRASYPGYRSNSVSLGYDRLISGGVSDKISITLHPLANVKGSTISVTTAMAPKHAQKEYEKGIELAGKGKFDDAEKHLSEATDSYPKYAIAWYALGQIEQQKGNAQEARKSFESAIAADNRYVSPYDRLALLSAQQSKWDETASFSKRAIDLNPVEFPSAFWYNALANYNLKRLDEAEKSAKQLLQLDSGHKYAQADTLLARISLEKGDLSQAAVHMRAYLAAAPNAQDAASIREALAKIDQKTAQAAK